MNKQSYTLPEPAIDPVTGDRLSDKDYDSATGPTQIDEPRPSGNRVPHKAHLNAHGRKIKALVAAIREKGGHAHLEPELAQLDESGEILENFAWGE